MTTISPDADIRGTARQDAVMSGSADVVVVGGGIAGSALATVLARDGYDVVVLERQTTYRDKVRGEAMAAWGVAETQRLDLEKPLLAASGHYATRGVFYDEVIDPALAEAVAAPLDKLLPGVPGVLDVGHPEACEALIDAATSGGATVIRGIGDIDVTPGDPAVVRYEHDDVVYSLAARLVVGADGRLSTVRRQAGIELHQTPARTMAGGLLVDGLRDWPAERLSLGSEGDLKYFVFPRADGRARLYLLHDLVQRGRFAGPDRDATFLAAFGFGCIPGSEMFLDARPVGPCAFYPMNDSWTEKPFAPGVVLIGDAAGWNDPIIGQGLSIAMRDVRVVTDILRAGSDWSVDALAAYGEERRERMRRLRIAAELTTDLSATFTPAGVARRRAYDRIWQSDPVLAGIRMSVQLGPDRVPKESFDQATVDRIRALS